MQSSQVLVAASRWCDIGDTPGREAFDGTAADPGQERSDDHFRRIVWALPDVVLVLDRSGRVIECNEHADLIAPRGEIIGRLVTDILPPDLADRELRATREALATGRQVAFEYSLEIQGRSMWFETRFRSFDDDRVLQIIRNIDSEKAAERERARLETEAAIKEDRLSRAQAVAKMGSWERDYRTGVLWWSDEVYELFETDKTACGSTFDALQEGIHPDDREAVSTTFAAALADHSQYHMIHRLLMNDGRIKWMEERCVTDFDDDGTPLVSFGTVRDITEGHLIGEELRQFKETLDQTLDCVFIFDAESLQFSYVNKGAILQLGYDEAELMQMHPFDIKPEFSEPRFRSLIAPLLADEKSRVNFETVHRRKDGHLVPVEISVQYVTSSGGAPRFIAVASDITERRQSEAALRASQQHLRHLVTSSPVLLYTCEPTPPFSTTFVSPNSRVRIGHPADSFTNEPDFWAKQIHPDDRQRVFDELETFISEPGGPAEHQHQYRFRAADGSFPWINDSVRLIRDQAGVPVELIGYMSDISVQKEAELALHQANEQLELRVAQRTAEVVERGRQLQRAQETARLGFWSANPSTGEIVWSDEVYRIIGRERDSFAPGRDTIEAVVHPDDLEQVLRLTDDAFAGKAGGDLDFRVMVSDGSIRWAHLNAEVELDSDELPWRTAGTLQDITERKNTEAAFVDARDRAELASLAKSEFLSHMSHELRTPLNAVLGFAEVLELGELSADQSQSVKEISRAGEHLLDMVDQVLDLSTIEAGHLKIEPHVVALDAVIESCVAIVSPLAASRNIIITTDPSNRWTVIADPIRLRQVLLNLLSNAVKFNHESGTIEVRCHRIHGQIRVSVQDDGIGIASGAVQRLFEPFERLETTHSGIKGAGIGLALSKRLVEAMNGSIGAETELGSGSTFWFELPEATRESGETAEEDLDAQEGLAPLRYRTVICVEDNPANLRLMNRIIKSRGRVRVINATSGEVVQALAREHRPDIILLDISLPGIDGHEVLRQLLADPLTAEIPVVAVSADAMPATIERGIAAGFSGYLTKPFKARQLLDLLESYLTISPQKNTP